MNNSKIEQFFRKKINDRKQANNQIDQKKFTSQKGKSKVRWGKFYLDSDKIKQKANIKKNRDL